MKSTPPDDASFEAWLRSSTSLPPLPDDRFSQRVLAALPPPAKQVDTARRWFCLVGAATGAAVALIGISASPGFQGNLSALDVTLTDAITQLATSFFGCALCVTLFSLWFAFRERLHLLPRW